MLFAASYCCKCKTLLFKCCETNTRVSVIIIVSQQPTTVVASCQIHKQSLCCLNRNNALFKPPTRQTIQIQHNSLRLLLAHSLKLRSSVNFGSSWFQLKLEKIDSLLQNTHTRRYTQILHAFATNSLLDSVFVLVVDLRNINYDCNLQLATVSRFRLSSEFNECRPLDFLTIIAKLSPLPDVCCSCAGLEFFGSQDEMAAEVSQRIAISLV